MAVVSALNVQIVLEEIVEVIRFKRAILIWILSRRIAISMYTVIRKNQQHTTNVFYERTFAHSSN